MQLDQALSVDAVIGSHALGDHAPEKRLDVVVSADQGVIAVSAGIARLVGDACRPQQQLGRLEVETEADMMLHREGGIKLEPDPGCTQHLLHDDLGQNGQPVPQGRGRDQPVLQQ